MPESKPRIPPTQFYVYNYLKWIGALWGNCATEKKIQATLYYEDGSTETLNSTEYSLNNDYIEYNVRKTDVLSKKVTKLVISVYNICAFGRYSPSKPFIVFEGDVDNPVFDIGDSVNFKIRIYTTISLAQSGSGQTSGQTG